jgi:integrating conjugative element relaxase (TIGR03760 family)
MGIGKSIHVIKEFILFHSPEKKTKSAEKIALKDLTRMVSSATLLAEPKRQMVLKNMKELCALNEDRYISLCDGLLNTLCTYFQNLAETDNAYYSQPGGLLDHALYRTEVALGLLKQFMVVKEQEDLSEEQLLWQYALYSASLLQGIGKLCIDLDIQIFDASGYALHTWNPLLNSLTFTGHYYNYKFTKHERPLYRQRINVLLARTLMPTSGFAWIASNPEVLEAWLALLQEDIIGAGTLGAILSRADAISIQRFFEEFMNRKALAQGAYRRGGPFETSDPLANKEQMTGIAFLLWLNQSLKEGSLIINQSPLFMVSEGLLISEELYKLFVQESPNFKNWQAVQKGFLSLNLHRQSAEGFASFEQTHTKHMHKGDIFTAFTIALPDKVQVHHLALGVNATVHAMQMAELKKSNNQFYEVQRVVPSLPELMHLSASGRWQAPENLQFLSNLGASKNG